VKTSLPGFKTTGYKGKSDRNLRTDQLIPGPYIESMSKGYTLPSFEDLVRGLHRLPSGLDARGLTTCMSWYLNIRDTFTPKLDLNVLHTQALIRALREPLKLFGPQNLDRNALEEWRSKGSFETVEIEHKKHQQQLVSDEAACDGRSQMHLNLDKEDVSMKVTLSLRHVMTFPFLALHGVFAEALKLGIKKSEVRRASRKGTANEPTAEESTMAITREDVDMAEDKKPNPIPSNAPQQSLPEEPNELRRTPKRPLIVETSELSSHKKPHVLAGPRNPRRPLRTLAPAPPPGGVHAVNRGLNIPIIQRSPNEPQHMLVRTPPPEGGVLANRMLNTSPIPRSPTPTMAPHDSGPRQGGGFRNRTWMSPALLAARASLTPPPQPQPPPPPPPAQNQGEFHSQRQFQELQPARGTRAVYPPDDGHGHRGLWDLRPDRGGGSSHLPKDGYNRRGFHGRQEELDHGRAFLPEGEYGRRDFQEWRPDREGGSSYRPDDGHDRGDFCEQRLDRGNFHEQRPDRDGRNSYRADEAYNRGVFQERRQVRDDGNAYRHRDGYGHRGFQE